MRKTTIEDAIWRTSVISRDKKCVVCKTNKDLQAHHLDDYSHHVEKRFQVENGITLCGSCHTIYHTSYNISFRAKTTKKDFDNFIELIQKLKDKKIL